MPTCPTRLSLFGHTRLPSTDIELLEALSTHHDLHLWLPHPSDDLWRALADVHEPVPRKEDTSRHQAHHPLLDTLGRDLREMQRSLPNGDTDEFVGAATRPDTLLGWLQSDICANEVRPGSRQLRDDDRSVQIHSCHGPPDRSTCCARCCWACCTTTRRSNRATSSSCARTSRPTRR